nr:iron chelate uptake ABC transporter family permease subunit [Lentibacillus sp. CBA3610]
MRLWILIIVTIILSVISLFLGAIDISLNDLLDLDSDELQIFLISRVPRLLAIIMAGAGMSIAGLIMQSLSRNKFVSPTTAGTLDAARLGIMMSMLFITNVTYTQQVIFSFAFSLIGTFLFMQILDRIKFKDVIFVPLIGINVMGIIFYIYANKFTVAGMGEDFAKT